MLSDIFLCTKEPELSGKKILMFVIYVTHLRLGSTIKLKSSNYPFFKNLGNINEIAKYLKIIESENLVITST